MLPFSTMRRVILLINMCACVAWAGAAENREKATQLLERFRDGKANVNETANQIKYLGEERYATDELIEMLGPPKTREKVLLVLSQVAIYDLQTEHTLLEFLKDPDISVVMLSLRTLGHINAVKSVAPIAEKLADDRVGVRKAAAEALGQLKQKTSGAALMSAVAREKELDAKVAEILAAGQANDPRQVKALEALLTDDSEATRLAATQALCQMGQKKGLAEVQKLLSSPEEARRLQGVKMFEGSNAAAAKNLKPSLMDASVKVRAMAGRIMAQAGVTGMIDWLVLASAAASIDDRLIIEREIEPLRLSDAQRNLILKKAK